MISFAKKLKGGNAKGLAATQLEILEGLELKEGEQMLIDVRLVEL